MLITKRTKTRDILPLLNEERMKTLIDAIPEYPLEKPLLEMTIGEFIDVLDDGYALKYLKERRAYKAFGKMKSFKNQLEAITNFLEMNNVDADNDQRAAANGVQFITFEENMLYTTAEFFHLKSFDEAEKVKLSNYLLINKKNTSETKYQYNLNKIMERKQKTKNGRR